MTKQTKLTSKTSLREFENNYWYALDLKAFAKTIRIKGSNKLRKDQLEKIIKNYLSTGLIVETEIKTNKARNIKDYENSPLDMSTLVKNYCSNKITKTFILDEAKRIQSDLPQKSGVWYWINRWREDQLETKEITYGDIINQFIELSNKKDRLPRVPSTKFNNFITDFLAANEGCRSEAIAAWEQLKESNVPKSFKAWGENKNIEQ